MAASPNFLSSGNTQPSTIVTDVGQAENTVIQCSSSSIPVIGIAQEGTFFAPGVTGSDSYAAHDGQELRVYGIGEVGLCVSNTTITAGATIKPASNGFGTPVTSADSVGCFTVGRALEGTTGANILFRVLVNPAFVVYTANSHP